MKKVLIINGPNLNLIGTRETEIYGNISFDEIKNECIKKGKENNIEIDFRQTNSEGEIINWIHEVNNNYEGLIIKNHINELKNNAGVHSLHLMSQWQESNS